MTDNALNEDLAQKLGYEIYPEKYRILIKTEKGLEIFNPANDWNDTINKFVAPLTKDRRWEEFLKYSNQRYYTKKGKYYENFTAEFLGWLFVLPRFCQLANDYLATAERRGR